MQTTTLRLSWAFVGLLSLANAGFGDEPGQTIPRGALGSGANLGQAVSGEPGSLPLNQTISPLNRGIGQIVSGWTQDGIHGQELAARIHQLQGKDFRDRGFQRSRERFDRDRFEDRREGARDRREDRRETDRDRREDRRETERDRREDRKEIDRDRDRREDRKEDRREADRDRREDRRETDRERKEDRSGKEGKSPGKNRR